MSPDVQRPGVAEEERAEEEREGRQRAWDHPWSVDGTPERDGPEDELEHERQRRGGEVAAERVDLGLVALPEGLKPIDQSSDSPLPPHPETRTGSRRSSAR